MEVILMYHGFVPIFNTHIMYILYKGEILFHPYCVLNAIGISPKTISNRMSEMDDSEVVSVNSDEVRKTIGVVTLTNYKNYLTTKGFIKLIFSSGNADYITKANAVHLLMCLEESK